MRTLTASPLQAALRRAGPLALAGLASNGANVIVTVLVARLLSERDYGEMAQVIGLFLVLAMPGSALLVAVVRRVAAWETAGEGHRIGTWAAMLHRRALLGLAGFAVAVWQLRDPFARALHIGDRAALAEVLVAGAGWCLLAMDRGLLQAARSYGALAGNLLVEGAARTVATLGLIGVGVGVQGASLGLLAALVAADVHARASLRRSPPWEAMPPPADADLVTAPVVPERSGATGRRALVTDAIGALAALALLAALQNLDVIILGRERPAASGAYAAISVASKALVFAAFVLSGYLLPEAAVRWHRGEHARRPLAAALVLVAVPTVLLTAVAGAVPRTLLRVVFGPDLTEAAPAFATLAVAMGCLAATVLFTHYLLGVGHRGVVGVLGVAVVAAVGLLTAAGGDPVGTARVDLGVHAVLALVTGAAVWRLPDPPPVPR